MKRRKPFPASLASRKHLEASAWTVGTVESRIPHTFITRDLFGFADLIAVSPSRGIMLVQCTGHRSTTNGAARIDKVKAEARAGIWLAAGGRIQVHSWEQSAPPQCSYRGHAFGLEEPCPYCPPIYKGRWCRIVEIRKGDVR